MRLIDADALKFDIMCVYGSNPQYINWLNHAPTVDAVPVRHGKWLWLDGVRCSKCNYKLETTWLPNYCPNCGADMRGTEDGDK